MMFRGKWYDEVAVGERFGTSLTVTEAHLVAASGLFGDFNPLHVDEEFSKMYFSRTALAYLEHHCRFSAPVRPGRHAHHRASIPSAT